MSTHGQMTDRELVGIARKLHFIPEAEGRAPRVVRLEGSNVVRPGFILVLRERRALFGWVRMAAGYVDAYVGGPTLYVREHLVRCPRWLRWFLATR